MNRKEIFVKLHEIYTGEKNKKHSTIQEYENLSPSEALKKANEYLKWSKKGQDECKSDSAYWSYSGDISLAKVLIAIFDAIQRGKKDFPEIDIKEGILMDKISTVESWAYNLTKN